MGLFFIIGAVNTDTKNFEDVLMFYQIFLFTCPNVKNDGVFLSLNTHTHTHTHSDIAIASFKNLLNMRVLEEHLNKTDIEKVG